MLAVDGTDRYIYGPLGEPLVRITSGGTSTFIHQDHLGSTRILTNSRVGPVRPAAARRGLRGSTPLVDLLDSAASAHKVQPQQAARRGPGHLLPPDMRS